MNNRLAIIAPLLAIFLLCSALLPGCPSAHTLQGEALPNVGVDEKPGARVPLDHRDHGASRADHHDPFHGRSCRFLPVAYMAVFDGEERLPHFRAKGHAGLFLGLMPLIFFHPAIALLMLLVIGRMWVNEGESP